MKAGELSQPVVTEFAIQLIKVNDRRAGKPNDYKRIHDDVREFHNEEMFQTLLGDFESLQKSRSSCNKPLFHAYRQKPITLPISRGTGAARAGIRSSRAAFSEIKGFRPQWHSIKPKPIILS